VRYSMPSSGRSWRWLASMLLLAIAAGASAQQVQTRTRLDPLTTADPTGLLQTSTPSGQIDTGNPFFQSLGVNGRTCNSCHRQAEAWTVSAAEIQRRFNATRGLDPIFALVDGADSPLDDVSTFAARKKAFSMLTSRGVIRVGLAMPANARDQPGLGHRHDVGRSRNLRAVPAADGCRHRHGRHPQQPFLAGAAR